LKEGMWAFKEREKKIFKKMFPSEYFGRTVQCPNGGEVTVEELFKVFYLHNSYHDS